MRPNLQFYNSTRLKSERLPMFPNLQFYNSTRPIMRGSPCPPFYILYIFYTVKYLYTDPLHLCTAQIKNHKQGTQP